MEEILKLAAEHGLPVLFPAVAAVLLWKENKELNAFIRSLLKDAE